MSVFVFRSDRLPGELLFTASSLKFNEAFWHLPPHHPANTSTAPVCRLHPFPLPPAETYAHRHTNTRAHAYTDTERNDLSYIGSKQRFGKAHVLRCCLCICSLFEVLFGRIAALSLNKEKRELSQKTGLYLVLLFNIVHQRNHRMEKHRDASI